MYGIHDYGVLKQVKYRSMEDTEKDFGNPDDFLTCMYHFLKEILDEIREVGHAHNVYFPSGNSSNISIVLAVERFLVFLNIIGKG
ncbi:MAG: hypothetical protein GY820_00430 [Gammaproteobacteria bacterium]|nr:hypothetical protein [Gammaproteobacteria bacterium]